MSPLFLAQCPYSKDILITIIEVLFQCPEKKDPDLLLRQLWGYGFHGNRKITYTAVLKFGVLWIKPAQPSRLLWKQEKPLEGTQAHRQTESLVFEKKYRKMVDWWGQSTQPEKKFFFKFLGEKLWAWSKVVSGDTGRDWPDFWCRGLTSVPHQIHVPLSKSLQM